MKCPDMLRCEGCLEPCSSAVCEHCHWVQGTDPTSSHYLPPGTGLHDYLLARVLGSGGFGITYLAWDCNLACKVAIKEYFPVAYTVRSRDRSTVVTNHDRDSKDAFDHGLKKFLEEGQALARFNGFPGIASVRTFLSKNGTSYLVLDYQDGFTLQKYVSDAPNGRIGYQEAVDLLMPVMDTLREVHSAGILHRDISPDNIQINSHRQVKLLDFGSAKHHAPQTEHTKMVVHKIGYSPEEQCRSGGKQGYWTDVYALGATFYFAITGQKPQDSLDRLAEDNLVPPSKLGIPIPASLESVLLKALAVRAVNRFQTVREFQDAVVDALPARISVKDRPAKSIQFKRWFETAEPKFLQAIGALNADLKKLWQKYEVPAARAFAAASIIAAIAALVYWLAAVPQITQFSVQPNEIRQGKSARLQWSVKGGSVAISPAIGAELASGTRSVSPLSTTTYTLTAGARIRTISRSVKVVVVPRASATLKTNPASITAGQPAELSWDVSGVPKSIVIMPEIGEVSRQGHRQVSPNASTTYTLQVVDSDGTTVNADATVSVTEDNTSVALPPSPKPPVAGKPVVMLVLQSPSIKNGDATVLRWSVSGKPSSILLNGQPVDPKGSRPVSPNQSTVYRLTARNAAGTSSKTIALTILGPPQVVVFKAAPDTVAPSQTFVISWSVVGQVQSVTFDSQKVSLTGSKTMKAPSLPAFTRYMLLARGPGGDTKAYVEVKTIAPK